MGKRFTETDKWKDPWFRRLEGKNKLIWIYLLDNCDNAGIMEIDFELMDWFIGEKIDEKDFWKVFDKRIIKVTGNKFWIPKFIEFQYGELSENCKPHKNIIEKLKKYGLYDKNFIGYPKGIYTLQEKEKEKEQEKEKEKDLVKNKKVKKKQDYEYPNLEEVLAVAKQEQIEIKTAENFFYHYSGQGWLTAGHNPQPIKNWIMKLRQFNLNEGKFNPARASPGKEGEEDKNEYPIILD